MGYWQVGHHILTFFLKGSDFSHLSFPLSFPSLEAEFVRLVWEEEVWGVRGRSVCEN